MINRTEGSRKLLQRRQGGVFTMTWMGFLSYPGGQVGFFWALGPVGFF
jgi:hypothetical protein